MVSQSITDIDAFIDHLIAEDIKSNLRDFTLELHGKFYPHINIEFMDEFLALAARENENQFIVHHDMLIKYGIAKGMRNSEIKRRLDGLGLIEQQNYRLRKLMQPVKQGGFSTKHVYMLTPESFFIALIRANAIPNMRLILRFMRTTFSSFRKHSFITRSFNFVLSVCVRRN